MIVKIGEDGIREGSRRPPRPDQRRRGGWGRWGPGREPPGPLPPSRSPSSPGFLLSWHPKVPKERAALALIPTRRRTRLLSHCPYPSAGRAVPQRVPTAFYSPLSPPSWASWKRWTYYGICARHRKQEGYVLQLMPLLLVSRQTATD